MAAIFRPVTSGVSGVVLFGKRELFALIDMGSQLQQIEASNPIITEFQDYQSRSCLILEGFVRTPESPPSYWPDF